MSKNKTYQFTTEIAPETKIVLSGRYGRALKMSLDDGSASKTIILDTDSIIRLQTFLSDYLLRDEPANSTAPTYKPTGRAVALMDGDTLDILSVLEDGGITSLDGAEADAYKRICEKFRDLSDNDLPNNAVFIFFDTFKGSISMNYIRRILRACISYQVDFVRTGDFSRSRTMILEDIEAFTTIEKSQISRATRDILIVSSAGTFTMKSADASLNRPSLFDEGLNTYGGKKCSRKAVLASLRDTLDNEDKTCPYTDDEIAEKLAGQGYDIARRTVVKYRKLLGFPKSSERRRR